MTTVTPRDNRRKDHGDTNEPTAMTLRQTRPVPHSDGIDDGNQQTSSPLCPGPNERRESTPSILRDGNATGKSEPEGLVNQTEKGGKKNVLLLN